ncbi:hypothetical protein ACLQ25_09515 [Micromonospora sp. DT44]|uniref:hypothetical protein n=1 Tax=Micromonospora sp. DT44 TaxID=3393439 RepID=UPI003CE96ACD
MAALTVDHHARTITGLVVPYGRIAVNRGRRWRYAPRCLRWQGRVPLLVDHDQSQRVGWAVDLRETRAGLRGLFAVDRGPAGDRALALAAVAGLSAGVDLTHTVPDATQHRVVLVVTAELDEVSLTRTPAFE